MRINSLIASCGKRLSAHRRYVPYTIEACDSVRGVPRRRYVRAGWKMQRRSTGSISTGWPRGRPCRADDRESDPLSSSPPHHSVRVNPWSPKEASCLRCPTWLHPRKTSASLQLFKQFTNLACRLRCPADCSRSWAGYDLIGPTFRRFSRRSGWLELSRFVRHAEQGVSATSSCHCREQRGVNRRGNPVPTRRDWPAHRGKAGACHVRTR